MSADVEEILHQKQYMKEKRFVIKECYTSHEKFFIVKWHLFQYFLLTLDFHVQCIGGRLHGQCIDIRLHGQCIDIRLHRQCIDIRLHGQCIDIRLHGQGIDIICTIASKINVTPKGVRFSELHLTAPLCNEIWLQ